MPATYDKIATQTLGSAANTVTFSTISGSYTDLVLVVNALTTSDVQTYIQYNGDTSSAYSVTVLLGDGTSATSSRAPNENAVAAGGYGTSGQGNKIVQIQNYSNSTTNKTALIRANSNGFVQARIGLWRNTAAITSLSHYVTSGNFIAGSTFTLYGIKAA